MSCATTIMCATAFTCGTTITHVCICVRISMCASTITCTTGSIHTYAFLTFCATRIMRTNSTKCAIRLCVELAHEGLPRYGM